MDFIPPFGDWLRQRRQQLGLTQGDLARRVGCAAITIRKLESGERQPSSLVAERMAEHLEVPDAQHTAFVAFATGTSSRQGATNHGNVPAALNPLIGRAVELALAQRLLRKHEVRLLTFLGPPGVGKTRLAQQVAATAGEHFADGAWFVALASVTDPAIVPTAIAMALGAGLDGSFASLDALKRYVGERRLLLVLDNLEHLPAAAGQVAELLTAAPGVKVLATSREPLHITGEHELPVPPLALPDRQTWQAMEALAHCPSVQLFLQRAKAVQSDFHLDKANAPDIVAICHRLDGLPLAIELAAARIKHTTPHELLAGLGRDSQAGYPFRVLSGGPQDLPSRQQTVWNAIDWSYGLLSIVEQVAFRRLGVFVGGCTLEAAEAVLDQRGNGLPCIDLLHSLIDKSLLQQVREPGRPPRFLMLELIREYALTRLNASDEAEAVRRRHAEYFAGVIDRIFPIRVVEEMVIAKGLAAEFGNLQTALAWCQAKGLEPEVELGLAVVISWFLWFDELTWGQQLWTASLIGQLHRALSRADAALETLRSRPGLLFGLARLTGMAGNRPRAWIVGAEAVAACRRVGDRLGEANVLFYLGHVGYESNDYVYASQMLKESTRLARESGDEVDATRAFCMLGNIALEEGRFAEAADILTQALEVWQRLGINDAAFGGASHSYLMLGLIAQLCGDVKRAIQYEETCISLVDIGGKIWAWFYLARARLMEGQVERAEQLITQGLARLRDSVNSKAIAVGLDGLAAVRWAQRRTREAVTLAAAVEPIRRALGNVTPVTILNADHAHMLAQIRPLLDDPSLAAAWAEGENMTMDQALAYALADNGLS